MSIKVGIVGFGFIGKMHLSVYLKNPDAEVVTICDLSKDALKKENLTKGGNIDLGEIDEKKLNQIAAYSDFDEFLNHDGLDLVDVCLPTYLHCDYTVRALGKGKHVICEKPMSLTLKEADKMIAAAEKSGKSLFIAHCIRFWPEYVWLKQAVDENRYGRVGAAIFKRVSPMPTWTWENWIIDEKRSGDAALDLHVHDTDFVNYLFGKPQEVFSRGAAVVTGGMDMITTQYIYKDVSMVLAIGSWGSPSNYPFEMAFTVLCEKATIEFSSSKKPTLIVYKADGSIEHPEVDKADGYTREIEYFLNCVKDGKKPTMVTPQDGRFAVEFVLREKKKARS